METLRITLASAMRHVEWNRPLFIEFMTDDGAKALASMLYDLHPELVDVDVDRKHVELEATATRPFRLWLDRTALILTFGNAVDAVAFRLRWSDDLDFVERDAV